MEARIPPRAGTEWCFAFPFLEDYNWHANQVWSRLVTGTTGWRTQLEFNDYIVANPGIIHVKNYYPKYDRDMQVGDLGFFYDSYEGGCVRVKTVYTGTNVNPVGWFR